MERLFRETHHINFLVTTVLFVSLNHNNLIKLSGVFEVDTYLITEVKGHDVAFYFPVL